MSGLDAAATLSLGVLTGTARTELALLRGEIDQARASLQGLSGLTIGPGLLRGISEIKTGLSSLLSEVKLINRQMVDASEASNNKIVSAGRKANADMLSDQRAYHRVAVALRDEAKQAELGSRAELTKMYEGLFKEQEEAQVRAHALAVAERRELDVADASFMKEWNALVLAQAKEREYAQTLMHKVAVAERLEADKEAAAAMRVTYALTMERIKEEEHARTLMHKVAVAERLEQEQLGVEASAMIQHQKLMTEKADLDAYLAKHKSAQEALVAQERLRVEAQSAIWKNAQFATASPAARLSTGSLISAASAGGMADAAIVERYGSAALLASKNLEALRAATQNSTSATGLWNTAHRDAHDVARGLSGALGGLWMTYGQVVPLVGAFAIAASLREAVVAGKDFEYQMRFVQAVSGESATAIDGVSKSLMTMAQNSMFTPVEMARGMRILAQAGMGTADALSALPTMMALATVGETDLTTAVEAATGIMHAFNLEVSDLGMIGDVIAKAAAVSITSVESMTQSLKQASTVASQYDLKIGEVSAALVVLAQRNIVGQAAGTAFRNMMNELSAPSSKAAAMMDKLNISMYDGQGNAKNLGVVMEDLRSKLHKYDKQSQNLVFASIFSQRGGKEAQAMFALTNDEWNKLVANVTDSSGFLTKSMAILQDTVEGQFKGVFSTLQASLIGVFQGSSRALVDMAVTMKSLFRSEEFTNSLKEIANAVVNVTNAVLKHLDIIALVGGAYVVFHTGRVAISALVTVWEVLKSVQIATATVTAISTVAFGVQGSVLATTLSPASLGAATALRTLTLAMLANPITAILTGVTLLAGAYLLLRDNTDKAAIAAGNLHDKSLTSIDLLEKENAALENLIDTEKRELGLKQSKHLEDIDSQKAVLEAQNKRIAQLQADPSAQAGAAALASFQRGEIGKWTLPFREGVSLAKELNQLLQDRKKTQAEIAKAENLQNEKSRVDQVKKFMAADAAGGGTTGTNKLSAPQKGGRSGPSRLIQDYNEQTANYADTLSNINKGETDVLALLKEKHDIGLTTEEDYLSQRKAIRDNADAEARKSLDAYLDGNLAKAEKSVAAFLKLDSDAAKALAKLGGPQNKDKRESLQAEYANAADQRLNEIAKYQGANDKAVADAQARSLQRDQANVSDAYAGLKTQYGNPDEQIKKSKEMIRGLQEQLEAKRNLTTREEDKNIVEQNGALARQKALIEDLKANQVMLGVTDEQIQVAQKKYDLELSLHEQYAAIKKEEIALDQDWVHGAMSGLKDYATVTTSASKVAGDVVKKSFKGMEDAIVEFTQTGKFNFSGMIKSMIADLVRLGTQMFVTQPLARMFGGASAGGEGLGLLGSLVSSSGMYGGFSSAAEQAAVMAVAAKGDVFGGPGIGTYRNTVVSSPTLFPFANGIGLMGEKPGSPGEAIMPLTRTSNGDLGVKVATPGSSDNSSSPTNHFHINISGVKDEGGLRRSAGQIAAAAAGLVHSAQRFT